MMEVPEPEEKKKEKKVEEIRETAKKEKKTEPKKEKLVDRIIRVLFGSSNDPDTENKMKGVFDRMFLNSR